MKSKLVLLALMGALALGSSVPNAMAKSGIGNHAAQGPNTAPRISSRAFVAKKDVTKRHVGASSPSKSTPK